MSRETMTDRQRHPAGTAAERVIGDLVLAEVFFAQATIESAAALGDGIAGLREQLGPAGTEHSSARRRVLPGAGRKVTTGATSGP